MAIQAQGKAGKRCRGTACTAVTAAFIAATLLSAQASAHIDQINQIPLTEGGAVEPNILFIIDESGSMFHEIMLLRGSGGYSGNVKMFEVPGYGLNNRPMSRFAGNAAAFFRSSHNNTVYYDPAVTYQPWTRADNSLMPNAPATAAPNHPMRPELGHRNLTQNLTEQVSWMNDDNTVTPVNAPAQTYFPATYFFFNAGSPHLEASYEKVEIRPGTTYQGHGRGARSDCTDGVCTYAEEIQNFANWYTYYRNRIFASQAGIGRAFAALGGNVRVGFGKLNGAREVDGVHGRTVMRGVRSFSGANRDAFFDILYDPSWMSGGTPLHGALQGAGQYFSRTDDLGPWSTTPGQAGGEQLACRRNFAILMTDGHPNPSNPNMGLGNVDGTIGPTHTAPDGRSFTYNPVPPFADNHSDTLADVAMHYWKHDLRPDMPNIVPSSARNPAFWQHMVTFAVGLGVSGNIDPELAFAAVDDPGIQINWPAPTNNAARIDDLLHAAVNGRGGFFSSADPVAFAASLISSLGAIVDQTGSPIPVTTNASRLQADSKIFQPRYFPQDWSGRLAARNINPQAFVQNLPPDFDWDSIPENFNINPMDFLQTMAWEASDRLRDLPHGERNIVTWNPQAGPGNNGAGVEFRFNQLSNAQRQHLTAPGASGPQRLDYLRGDQQREQQNGGSFRNRNVLLGDIVNSAPVFVGNQDFGYGNTAADNGTYALFLASKRDREPMIYVGANDGMLHGFDANTGLERFAFVPNAVFPKLIELTRMNYSHRYFVDATPTVADAFINGGWKTVAVGGLGAGGKSIYALDVSTPNALGPQSVLWEFTHPELGYVLGSPNVVRLNNGRWAVVVGNGYHSDSHRAQLFVIDLETGVPITIIDTLAGPDQGPINGLSATTTYDAGFDGVVDRIYAGDLQGNLWAFDLSSNAAANWGSRYAGAGPVPLFQARDNGNTPQPITAAPRVARTANGYAMVFFGTGQFFETAHARISDDDPVNSFYAVIDKGQPVAAAGGRDTLTKNTISNQVSAHGRDLRVVKQEGSRGAGGWYLDLVVDNAITGERVVFQPMLRGNRVIFTTLIPASEDPCQGIADGFLMELNALTGNPLQQGIWDLDSSGKVTLVDSGERNSDGPILTNPSGVNFPQGGAPAMPAIIGLGATREVSIGNDGTFLGIIRPPRGRAWWRQVR